MKLIRVLRMLGLVLAATGMVLGAALVFLAWKHASLPAAILAVALLLGCPAIALIAVLTSPSSPLSMSLALVRFVRAHVCMAASWGVVLWFCEIGGLFNLPQFAVYYSVATVVSLVAYLPWLAREERRLRARAEESRLRTRESMPEANWAQK
jgi:hypothetical protein